MIVLLTGHALLQLRQHRWPPIAVALVGWTCVFASPYAVDLPAYYRSTAVNPSFSSYLTEWQPTHFTLETAPFYLLAFGAVFMLGRVRNELTPTEKWLLLATLFAGLLTLRNIAWFALVGIMLLPRMLDLNLRPRDWSRAFNRFAAIAGVALVVAAVVAVVDEDHVGRYPDASLAAISASAGDSGLVYADSLYADWLIGVAPRFKGRVAYDARFEILSKKTLDSLVWLRLKAIDLPQYVRRYRVFVLHSGSDSELVQALLARGFTTRYKTKKMIVLARPNTKASAATS